MAEAFWTPVNEAQLRALYDDVGASEESVQRDLASLRGWMAKQLHFPALPDNADQWIGKYLLRCKNSMERTKDTLDHLFSSRNTMPEFFANRDPFDKQLQESFKQAYIATMPTLTPDGERVHVYGYPEDADAALFDVQTLFKRVTMMAELVMRDDLSRGEIIIIDLKHGSPSRLAQFTTHAASLKRLANDGLKMYPSRLKQLHFINAPPFIAMILNLLSLVLKDKLFKRIHIHPAGLEALHKQIPKESLPSDYEGTGPSIAEANEKWRLFLEGNTDWFKSLEAYRTDETKRIEPKASFVHDEILGCQGSFRQLAVD